LAASCGSDDDGSFRDPFGGNRDGVGGDDDGSRGDGGSRPAVNDCAAHTVKASRAKPDMLIVLDRSASMAPEGNPSRTDRWTGSVDAVTEVTSEFDDRISFGLMTFPGTQGGGGRGGAVCTPGMMNVNIGPERGDEIGGALAGMGPGGYTPTASTLQEAAKVIGSAEFSDQTVVPPKYVLLVTDGDPNCSAGGLGPTTEDPVARQATIDAIKALTNAGVQTFVVGYQTGSSNFAATLDQMAAAGGTGQMKHRSVESGADLTKAFEDLAGRAVSCSYKLEAPVADASFVRVSVDKKPRMFQNISDGWTLGPDKQTVTLVGAACDAVRKGSTFTVQVVCEPEFVQ
jgi:hypothetical protein